MKKRNIEKPFRNDGFTIVEIVVVMLLMLCAIWPMGRIIASALEASNDEQYLTHCAFLAQMKMEQVRWRTHCYSDEGNCTRLAGIDEQDFATGVGGFDEGPGTCGFDSSFADYKCEVVDDPVTPVGQCQSLGRCLKAVRVTVWFDKDGDNTLDANNEPSVLLESYLTARAPMPRTGL